MCGSGYQHVFIFIKVQFSHCTVNFIFVSPNINLKKIQEEKNVQIKL